MRTDPTERADLDPEGVDDAARSAEVEPNDTSWPAGALELSPTEMWMEHKGWAS